MSGWAIGAVRQLLADGGDLKAWDAPGWIRGELGIDYRTYIGRDQSEGSGPCYALTYLPTGLLMGVFASTLAEVQAFADDVAAALIGKDVPAAPVSPGCNPAPAFMQDAVIAAQQRHQLVILPPEQSLGFPRFDRWIMEERTQ